ncbi:pyrroline-5-carboxylate reductase [Phlyctema vagabunda]|uniref:Pyrroline-5-carboxylate reductase n=1 Tax=Phlyctema vagabunda TaxID=108571 RepID=A0ABR4P3R1_9HELO
MTGGTEVVNQPQRVSIAILGCGKMGTAILQGLLAAPPSKYLDVTHITATVRTRAAADRILHAVQESSSLPMLHEHQKTQSLLTPRLTVKLQEENGQVAQDCDILLLGCKPHNFQDILQEPDVQRALLDPSRSKILISVIGGVTVAHLEQCLYDLPGKTEPRSCTIARAIPNMAACIHRSITVISAPSRENDERSINTVNQLFSLVGPVIQLPEIQFSNASALASSSIAFYASLISASADGTVSVTDDGSLSRSDALWISAHAAIGASSLILEGEDPVAISRKVATKGGSTEVGLKVMEENKVGAAMVSALSSCARATKGLFNLGRTQ